MEETPLISPDIDTTGFTKNLDDSVNSLQSLARKVDQLPLGIPDAPIDNIYYGRRNGIWTNLKTYFDTLYSALSHTHSYLSDAPNDGNYYGRRNNAWTNLKTYFDTLYSTLSHTHQAFPVGSVFISVVSTNPNTLLGYGTWSAFATGRTLVGIDAAQTEFDVVEETGGEKAHTLTSTEMPSHSHVQDAHTHTQNSHNHTQDSHNHTQNSHDHTQALHRHSLNGGYTDAAATNTVGVDISTTNTVNLTANAMDQAAPVINPTTATNIAATATNQAVTATNIAATATNQNTGSGAVHNNLQPYIVVYMWKRTS